MADSKECRSLAAHANTSTSVHSATSLIQATQPTSRWRIFHSTPKPRPKLVKPNELVWPVKRSKLNKYIYKKKTKLLTCKTNLEVMTDHGSGPNPKICVQLHPFGVEEDANKSVTVKVSIELPRKCQLHSETEIEFKVSAREIDSRASSSEAEIGPLKIRREQITRNFFYIKGFITHETLKDSLCDYVQVMISAKLK